jgi:histone-lysine N-methyltransferase SETMAR
VKVLLIVFFYWKGVVHHEFVPHGRIVNGQFYLEAMKRLREAVGRKGSEGWRNKTWMLHHDNTPAQTSLLISEFLTKHEATLVPQPPYSPDLAPADVFFCSEVEIYSERSPISEEIEEISL